MPGTGLCVHRWGTQTSCQRSSREILRNPPPGPCGGTSAFTWHSPPTRVVRPIPNTSAPFWKTHVCPSICTWARHASLHGSATMPSWVQLIWHCFVQLASHMQKCCELLLKQLGVQSAVVVQQTFGHAGDVRPRQAGRTIICMSARKQMLGFIACWGNNWCNLVAIWPCCVLAAHKKQASGQSMVVA